MKNILKNQYFILGALLFTGLALWLAVSSVKQRQVIKPKATAAEATMGLSPRAGVYHQGDAVTIAVRVKNTGDSLLHLRAVGFDLQIDKNVFDVERFVWGQAFPIADRHNVSSNGLISVSLHRDSSAGTFDLASGDSAFLTAIHLRVKSNAHLGITHLRFQRLVVPDSGHGDVNVAVLANAEQANFNIESGESGGGSGNKPDLVITDVSVESRVVHYIIKNQGGVAAGQSVTRYYINGQSRWQDYPPAIASGATLNRFFAGPVGSRFVCSTGHDQVKVCADIYNKVDESNENNNCKTITVTCNPNENPSPTATPVPTATPAPGAVILDFKIKFAGVSKQIAQQTVKVKIAKRGFHKVFDNVPITFDNQGRGQVHLIAQGVVPGGNYAIIVKGPKHLARKFCVNNPEARCSAGGQLTLRQGTNSFDFSNLPLLAGDIPNANGQQDGVVDSQDFSLLIASLQANAAADLRHRADLNFDGINNGADIQLFLNTMSKKYDDDF